jgi:hypothetical protein
MWIFLVVCLVCSVIGFIMMKTAPEGYEDETGFHYGKPQKKYPVDNISLIKDNMFLN